MPGVNKLFSVLLLITMTLSVTVAPRAHAFPFPDELKKGEEDKNKKPEGIAPGVNQPAADPDAIPDVVSDDVTRLVKEPFNPVAWYLGLMFGAGATASGWWNAYSGRNAAWKLAEQIIGNEDKLRQELNANRPRVAVRTEEQRQADCRVLMATMGSSNLKIWGMWGGGFILSAGGLGGVYLYHKAKTGETIAETRQREKDDRARAIVNQQIKRQEAAKINPLVKELISEDGQKGIDPVYDAILETLANDKTQTILARQLSRNSERYKDVPTAEIKNTELKLFRPQADPAEEQKRKKFLREHLQNAVTEVITARSKDKKDMKLTDVTSPDEATVDLIVQKMLSTVLTEGAVKHADGGNGFTIETEGIKDVTKKTLERLKK